MMDKRLAKLAERVVEESEDLKMHREDHQDVVKAIEVLEKYLKNKYNSWAWE